MLRFVLTLDVLLSENSLWQNEALFGQILMDTLILRWRKSIILEVICREFCKRLGWLGLSDVDLVGGLDD